MNEDVRHKYNPLPDLTLPIPSMYTDIDHLVGWTDAEQLLLSHPCHQLAAHEKPNTFEMNNIFTNVRPSSDLLNNLVK